MDFIVEKPEHSPHYMYSLYNLEDTKTHRWAVYRFHCPVAAATVYGRRSTRADPLWRLTNGTRRKRHSRLLALLNNKLAVAMAKHFAERGEDGQHRRRARYGCGSLGTGPRPDRERALRHSSRTLGEFGLANTCRVILNLNEFVFVD